jgi:hypothetical protein
MQPPSPTASTRPVVAPDAIKVTVRSSRGDGTRSFIVEAPASGTTIADVKRLLCRPPHSVCSDASTPVLVLKGKGADVAPRALQLGNLVNMIICI